MEPNFDILEFEQPLAELEIELRDFIARNPQDSAKQRQRAFGLKRKLIKKAQLIFAKLPAYQTVQLARHPQRPHFLDYVPKVFDDFDELDGDRFSGRGKTIRGGLATISGKSVVVIGIEKGRKIDEKIRANFGMPQPTDYRKANRLMLLAERFQLPLLTFIDTPGAAPGVEAEEGNQSAAIAENISTLSCLRVPIVSIILGEGGSGGALALALSDRLLMLEHSIYSVISPEGCATILYRDADKTAIAAESLRLSTSDLVKLGIVDKIIPEPLGGAHRNPKKIGGRVRLSILAALDDLQRIPLEELRNERYQKYISIGREDYRKKIS